MRRWGGQGGVEQWGPEGAEVKGLGEQSVGVRGVGAVLWGGGIWA